MIRRTAVFVLAFAALGVGLAGAVLAAADPVNEYAWMAGEIGAMSLPIDCDGPATWMIVAGPSVMLLLAGGTGAWMTGTRRSRLAALVIVTVSLALISSALPRVAAEARRNRDACQ